MELFIRLLIAHIITDFFIQPNHWVEQKNLLKAKSKYLYFHIALTGIVAWIFMAGWEYGFYALFIALSHGIGDYLKLTYTKDELIPFIIDQLYHVIILGLCALCIDHGFSYFFADIKDFFEMKTWAVLAGYMLITVPSGYLVGKATKQWQMELATSEEDRDSLKNAGVWIGILERILVLTFVLFQQFQAIGFLIAAKSILRFSDKNENHPRKQTEYVLIGTLISFTLALFMGLAINYILKSY
ncbi:DUF3307 domain-containing protein [Membranihabitans marinus]|uniref:DUF3307 domain-containing protein n=1 Tax=Membranihabitans marinus TaxID=1227546 RepID=UPI001F340FA9|nr:DUF3307 domain-containing protein [Membranihabitans marinus]